MSTNKILLNKIIIGTSAWGSKISYNQSIFISEKLIKFGFTQFDTAPNYGAGLSQYILNNVSKKKSTYINTKFGQKINFSVKEIIKRIYRYQSFKTFLSSNLIYLKYCFRKDKQFWSIIKIKHFLELDKKKLNNCKFNIFFLHNPPSKFLSNRFLKKFINLCKYQNLTYGISGVDDNTLLFLLINYKNFVFQLSLVQYLKYEKIIQKNNIKVHVNSLFKLKFSQKKFSIINYEKKIFQYFIKKSNVKLILGVNSIKSFKKLTSNIRCLMNTKVNKF